MSDQRGSKPSRATLNEVFEDSRVKFQLSVPVIEEECDGAPCKPYLINSVVGFGMVKGGSEKRGQASAVFPSMMRWLGFDDRLYMLDASVGTVISVEGLELSRPAIFETTRLE